MSNNVNKENAAKIKITLIIKMADKIFDDSILLFLLELINFTP